MVIEVDTVIQIKIQDFSVYILHGANILEKGVIPIILLLAGAE